MINDLPKVISILLNALKFDDHLIIDSAEQRQLDDNPYFSSTTGIQLLAEATKQIIQLRYVLCRNLLILEHILIQKFILNCNATEIIRSKCYPGKDKQFYR
jgi:nuclear pore complex protein Nup160